MSGDIRWNKGSSGVKPGAVVVDVTVTFWPALIEVVVNVIVEPLR